jgi:DedD protein
MENRKLLLVAVSVGLFLVIVISATILVFSPRDYPVVEKNVPIAPGVLPPSAPPPVTTQSPAVVTQTTPPSEAPAQAAGSETAVENDRSAENVIYINGDNGVRVERLNGGSTQTIITIPSPAESPAKSVPLSVPPSQERPSAVAAKPAQPTVTSTQQKPAAPKAASTPTRPKVQPKLVWWVQTNSYSNKSFADRSKELLAGKGIASVITNAVVGGKTYYRVRVGPYTSRSEADYWLSLIKTIEGMENSQIWQSP